VTDNLYWDDLKRLRMESPCTRKCAVDDGKCISCGRTMSEICNWTSLTEEQKQEIIDRIST